jgi:PAS domain S-box-containing protein
MWESDIRGGASAPGESPASCPDRRSQRSDGFASLAAPPPVGPRLATTSRIMGGLVAFIGAAALAGWAFDVPVLKSIHPQLISMKANTALGFVLLGVALAGGCAERALHRSLSAVLGGLVALLGATNLAEYALGVDLHIDQLLFHEPAGSLLTTHAGRLSPVAGLGFASLGVAALLTLGLRRGARLASSLGALSFGLALLALAGYGFGLSRLYDLGTSTPVALNSALALLLASMGVLLARTDTGVGAVLASSGAGGVLLRRLLPFAIALPVALDVVIHAAVRLGFLEAMYDDPLHAIALSGILAALVLLVANRLESADAGRRQVVQALRASEAHWRSLFENMTSACAYHRVVFEGETAVDYEFLEVNSAFERQTGLHRDAIVGRRVTEVIPGFAESGRDLIARYAEVARTGKAAQFETFAAGLERWYAVSAFSQEPGCFATAFLDITEQRRKADEVSQRLDLLRRMGNDILLLIAPDGSIVQANDRALRAYGYDEEEMVRLNVRDLRAPDARGGIDETLQRALSEDGLRFETRHVRRDGSTFPVEVSIRSLEIDGARLLQGVVRDIAAERAARAAIEYQAMLLENLHDAVIGIDVGLRVTAWNRAAERIFGWSRRDAMGRHVEEIVPSEYADGSSIEQALSRVAQTGRVEAKVRRRTRSGAWVEIEATSVFLRGDDGNAVGYVSVNRDISERKRAEAELRSSQERLRLILETANEGIWVVDAEGVTEFVNGRAAEMFGLQVERMLGRPFFEVVPESLRTAARSDRESIARGEGAKREMRVPRTDGSERWLVFSRGILRDLDGHVSGSVSVFTDVTQQRRAQQELEQARKLEAVGQLAAGIAHEINTPMQFIGDNTHFLGEAFGSLCQLVERCRSALSTGDLEAARRDVQRAVEELDVDYVAEQVPGVIQRTLEGVRRVSTIVRAMREFAHPDQHEMVASNLNDAILATLEVARSEYKYVADVETDLEDIPPVTCHAGDLNQVFLNLVVNAAHAIEQVVKGTSRRGTIRVATRALGQSVVIDVVDTGCGIPEQIHHQIFDPFFTTKEVGKGTGQGLAIAQRIIAKHHGELTFASEVGRGTTFSIRLPVDVTPPEALALPPGEVVRG